MGLCSTVPLSSSTPSTTSARPAATTLKVVTSARTSPLTSSTKPATSATSTKPATSTLKLTTTVKASTIKPLISSTQPYTPAKPASSTARAVTTAKPRSNSLTAAQGIVLDAHNNYRSQLAKGQALDNNNVAMPKGKNIYQLIYNQSMEDSAQLYANKCVWKHSGVDSENLYASSANLSFETALLYASNSWWSELAKHGMNRELNLTKAEFDKTVGHWSQMAWGRTTQLGCGVKWCPNGAPPLDIPSVTIAVCQYMEHGNYINRKVYEAGNPCSKDADCTTFPNSVCNVDMGLCSTVPLSSLPTAAPVASTTSTRPGTTVAPIFTPLTAAEQSVAVDTHNNYRSQLAKGQSVDNNNETMPQGKNIYQLTYNKTLEASAQAWANNCKFAVSGAGENVFVYSAKTSFETVLKAATKYWWSELARLGMNRQLNYTRAENAKTVSHWSQMAWGKTTLLGCGMTWCPNGAPPLTWPTATILVCHYRAVGNFVNQVVYEAGSPCAKNADCTTYANSYCDVGMGLCSTTP